MSLANVPLKPGIARPKAPTEYPKYVWSPEGVMILAKTAGDVPEGYTDYSPEDEARVTAAKAAKSAAPVKKAAPAPVQKPADIAPPSLALSKAETIAALKSGGIPHSPNTSHTALYDLLVTSLKNGLDEAKVVYDSAETDAKKLLSLFPSS